MLPDVTGIDKTFDYVVPETLSGRVGIGSVVRVPLGPRKVRGWVTDIGGDAPVGVEMRPIGEVSSLGPSPELVDLARWAAWRWAGRLRPFLLAGTPGKRVTSLPAAGRRSPMAAGDGPAPEQSIAKMVADGISAGVANVRLPPGASRLHLVLEVLRRAEGLGDVLVLVPTKAEASRLASLLERAGHDVALELDGWAAAAAGGRVVVGTRGAAFGPCQRLGAAVVLDAHSESYIETRAPTWNASVAVVERAGRAGAPCLLVSPCPTLELLALGPLVTGSRSAEREGWPVVEVIDRRSDDPRSGLYSSRLAALAHEAASDPHRPVVFVLNRTGRARLLACGSCGHLARCEGCGAALRQQAGPRDSSPGLLECPRCGKNRPLICAECGSTRMKILRVGTARAREEIEALTGLETVEVTARHDPLETLAVPPRAVVGTEAVLHRLPSASLVAFVDLDQELLSPRLRAAEQALGLMAAAARLLGGRRRNGRLAVQTRLPHHEVIAAAVTADPGRVAEVEGPRRARLALPPARAVAELSGPGASGFAGVLERLGTLEVARLEDQCFLVRARDHRVLCDALAAASAAVPAGGEHPRVEVDPSRL